MTIDFHCNLFTHASVKRDWYGTPEMSRIIEWWKLHEKVKGRTVTEFVAMMDEAGCDKVCIPAIRMYTVKRVTSCAASRRASPSTTPPSAVSCDIWSRGWRLRGLWTLSRRRRPLHRA